MPLPVIIVLDNVRSLHNVGAIFRTADAVDLKEIVLAGITPSPPRFEIDKTALGAVKSVAWQYLCDPKPYLLSLKAQGFKILALEQTKQAVSLYKENPTFPLVLIVGHEREGVEKELLAICDDHLFIPMNGTVHSLNVSNASAVALYELRRKYELLP
jgi:tRNA G18 (ribose-2'-O)-methylase SpoU